MATDQDLRPGTPVRYRYNERMRGVVLRYVARKSGDWLVQWEDGQVLEAYAENVDVLTQEEGPAHG